MVCKIITLYWSQNVVSEEIGVGDNRWSRDDILKKKNNKKIVTNIS